MIPRPPSRRPGHKSLTHPALRASLQEGEGVIVPHNKLTDAASDCHDPPAGCLANLHAPKGNQRMSSCTIVVPCYNEARRLDAHAFQSYVERGHLERFLFVDDGSTDGTAAILQELRDFAPGQFAFISLTKNCGKAEAVRQGVLKALDDQPDFVGYWDADLATPLDAIPGFCELMESKEHLQMVLGSRVKLMGRTIQRRMLRHYPGRVFATLVSMALRLPVYDTQCGAKLCRVSPEIRSLFESPFRSNWVFDVELIARFIRARRIAGGPPPEEALYEKPLDEWRDVRGSKVKPQDCIIALFELGVIYWTYLRGPSVAKKKARRTC
jgi:dolichyl-phosphate beta-glucosyltransferase